MISTKDYIEICQGELKVERDTRGKIKGSNCVFLSGGSALNNHWNEENFKK